MSFFSNVLWKIKKVIIFLLALVAVAGIIYLVVIFRERSKLGKFSAIIDADTGNGITDLLAISRAVADPEFRVIGLTSAQWNQNPESIIETVYLSQNLNDTLLKLFRREDIPHHTGGEKMLNNLAEPMAVPSEASEFIVRKANEASGDKKLNIITLGSLTNVATAILTDSTIIPRIRIYSLAMQYDPETKVWNKNEFNVRNDLDALDMILNTEKLEIHIMPRSVSRELILGLEEAADHMNNNGEPWDFIADRWVEMFPDRNRFIISDVALIEAFVRPDYIKEEQTNTPPENTSRKIFVYTSINKEFMKIDFWKTIKKYISDKN
jgi:purine nucleosidase